MLGISSLVSTDDEKSTTILSLKECKRRLCVLHSDRKAGRRVLIPKIKDEYDDDEPHIPKFEPPFEYEHKGKGM